MLSRDRTGDLCTLCGRSGHLAETCDWPKDSSLVDSIIVRSGDSHGLSNDDAIQQLQLVQPLLDLHLLLKARCPVEPVAVTKDAPQGANRVRDDVPGLQGGSDCRYRGQLQCVHVSHDLVNILDPLVQPVDLVLRNLALALHEARFLKNVHKVFASPADDCHARSEAFTQRIEPLALDQKRVLLNGSLSHVSAHLGLVPTDPDGYGQGQQGTDCLEPAWGISVRQSGCDELAQCQASNDRYDKQDAEGKKDVLQQLTSGLLHSTSSFGRNGTWDEEADL